MFPSLAAGARPSPSGQVGAHESDRVARQRVQVQVHNRSDVDYMLERAGEVAELSFPKQITLPAQKTVLLAVTAKGTQEGLKKVRLPFRVTNLLVGPDQPLAATIDLDVTFNGK